LRVAVDDGSLGLEPETAEQRDQRARSIGGLPRRGAQIEDPAPAEGGPELTGPRELRRRRDALEILQRGRNRGDPSELGVHHCGGFAAVPALRVVEHCAMNTSPCYPRSERPRPGSAGRPVSLARLAYGDQRAG